MWIALHNVQCATHGQRSYTAAVGVPVRSRPYRTRRTWATPTLTHAEMTAAVTPSFVRWWEGERQRINRRGRPC